MLENTLAYTWSDPVESQQKQKELRVSIGNFGVANVGASY